MEQKYYFQFRTHDAQLRWEEIPACIAKFEDEDAAMEYAVELADRFINCEVRLTDNAQLIGGKYFH
jgi:hypothetical protein